MQTIGTRRMLAIAVGILLLGSSVANSQSLGRGRTATTAMSAYDNPFAGRLAAKPSPALQYFGGSNVQAPPRPAPRRQLPPPQPVRVASLSKPFSNFRRPPAITPYLNLDVRQSDVGLPNYYAFVRPLLQQEQTNQSQRAKIYRMEQRINTTAVGGGPTDPQGGMPTTGHSTQFQNMGGYFPARGN